MVVESSGCRINICGTPAYRKSANCCPPLPQRNQQYKYPQLPKMSEKYTVPAQTRIGHIHLKVADLNRSLSFYRDLLGFEVTLLYGNQAAFVSAGGYHHHIGLNTWQSEGAPPAPVHSVGLYHTAIL